MLEVESGVEAIKSRGLRVIRAVIPKVSKLVGTNASETNFRQKYKAAIVAVQRGGKSVSNKLSQARFEIGDLLILQVSDDSPLLIPPPKDLYRQMAKGKKRFSSLSRFKKRISSFGSLSDAVLVDDNRPTTTSHTAEEGSEPAAESIDNDDAQSSIEDASIEDGSYNSGVSVFSVKAKILPRI
jgi:hypothetical protein